MDKILVGIGGILASLFVIWYFLFKPSKKLEAEVKENIQEAKIIVKGGYNPDTVELKKGIPARLIFKRLDPSGCLEEVAFPQFKILKKLPLNEETAIEFTPDKEGEFGFSCGMGMFHGKIIVR